MSSKIKRAVIGVLIFSAGFFSLTNAESPPSSTTLQSPKTPYQPRQLWVQRACDVTKLFQKVYTPGWEGAYDSIGDAYLFATTKDPALLRFHTAQWSFYNGNWVDDSAWACIAELKWWEVTVRRDSVLVYDAAKRYIEARNHLATFKA